MSDPFDMDARQAIKMALARESYDRDDVRIVTRDLDGYRWLVATHNCMFAVAEDRVCTAIRGWFFGVCRHDDRFYLFENCGLRDRESDLGRIVRIDWRDGRLVNPAVLVKGLHVNCHQIRVIGGLLCLVDTANQCIRRYSLSGDVVDVIMPFPLAPPTDTSGQYVHMNSVAEVRGRIGLVLHNGIAEPERCSELAWLDSSWNLQSRHKLDGYWCHDIVEDEAGVLWHCDSKAGAIINSEGLRMHIAEGLMTRAICLTSDRMVVGKSTFGPRQQRGDLRGGLTILDRDLNILTELMLDASPADIALLGQ